MFHFKLSREEEEEEAEEREQVDNYKKVAKLNLQITKYHNVPREQ